MDFRVLGPFEVMAGDRLVSIPAARQRVLLALLLIHANEVLSADRVMEELWGDDLPTSGTSALRFHVSKLRSVLGVEPSPVVTRSSGYVLEVDPSSIDAVRFEESLVAAAGAMPGAPDRARALVRNALALWRGDPYTGLGDPGFIDAETRRLNEMRVNGIELGFEAALARGLHVEVVADLEAALAKYPFREHLWAHLMVALYRAGRQADALRAYQRATTVLGAELGIEPSAELRDLEDKILLHDPALTFALKHRANLPTPSSTFIGRQDALDEVAGRCVEERMLTITGIGGIGKTRLAIETAGRVLAQFDDGVFFVDLSSVANPDRVAREFLSSMEITERPDRSVIETLSDHLSGLRRLIVVDNCEHVTDGLTETLGVVLRACPGVHVMATSRVRLGIDGESVWELHSLGTGRDAGDAGSGANQSEAARLFADRAGRSSRAFELTLSNGGIVEDICVTLDGIPLAIELAAARVRILTLDEIAARLSDRFALLVDTTRAGPERHRTLHATMEWSYDLLPERARATFHLLGVFRGGFNLDALASVSGRPDSEVLDSLEALIDASLLNVDTSGSTARYRLLTTVQAYALEHLDENDESDVARDRHVTHYAAMTREAFKHQRGAFRPNTASPAESRAWLNVLGLDLPNLRAALDWALATDDLDAAYEIVVPLHRYWHREMRLEEAIDTLTTVLNHGDYPPTPLHCAALYHLGQALADTGDLGEAEAIYDKAQEMTRHLDLPSTESWFEMMRGVLAEARGDIVEAGAQFAAALQAAEADHETRLAPYLWNVAFYALLIGDVEEATRSTHRLEAEGGDDPWLSQHIRGRIAAYRGHQGEALDWARRAIVHPMDRMVAAFIRQGVANALLNLGQLDEARDVGEAIEALHSDGVQRWIAERANVQLGLTALRSGDLSQAKMRLTGSVMSTQRAGNRYLLWVAFHAAAEYLAAAGDARIAAVILGYCASASTRHRYDPAALDGAPHVSLESLGAVLDRELLDALIAEGATATSDDVAEQILQAFAD
jgi:predicted ATPase/DNA-binding SARP family transcriptional activator